jgi:hypothetical protein
MLVIDVDDKEYRVSAIEQDPDSTTSTIILNLEICLAGDPVFDVKEIAKNVVEALIDRCNSGFISPKNEENTINMVSVTYNPNESSCIPPAPKKKKILPGVATLGKLDFGRLEMDWGAYRFAAPPVRRIDEVMEEYQTVTDPIPVITHTPIPVITRTPIRAEENDQQAAVAWVDDENIPF